MKSFPNAKAAEKITCANEGSVRVWCILEKKESSFITDKNWIE